MEKHGLIIISSFFEHFFIFIWVTLIFSWLGFVFDKRRQFSVEQLMDGYANH